MPTDSRAVAVDRLESLGLSAYAARTFVTLVGLGEATARDVSEASDVPRTHVYDAVGELEERGLVDVQPGSPKRFWAVSPETTGQSFEQTYRHRVETLREALSDVATGSRTAEQRGVWTVTGRQPVAQRAVEFVDRAESEVVYMTVGDLLGDSVRDALGDATDRGVDVYLAEMSDTVEADLAAAVPGARAFESLWTFSDTPAGRLLMVDRERTLVSVLVDGDGDHPPAPRDETAIWGSGESNGLVVVLRALFTWQLERD